MEEEIRKNLEELAKAYRQKIEVAKVPYDQFREQGGATADDAFKMVKEKFEKEFGFREETPVLAETPKPTLVVEKPRQLMLHVKESKELVRWAEGMWNVVVSDVVPDELPLGRVDSEGKPVINEVLRTTFQRNDGQTIEGISSRVFSTKSKLYHWYVAITKKIPEIGEDIDVGELIGKKCRIVVKDKMTKRGAVASQVVDALSAEE